MPGLCVIFIFVRFIMFMCMFSMFIIAYFLCYVGVYIIFLFSVDIIKLILSLLLFMYLHIVIVPSIWTT